MVDQAVWAAAAGSGAGGLGQQDSGRAGVGLGLGQQPGLLLGQHLRRRPPGDPVWAGVHLTTEHLAGGLQLGEAGIGRPQVRPGGHQVSLGDFHRRLRPALGRRVIRHAGGDRQAVMPANAPPRPGCAPESRPRARNGAAIALRGRPPYSRGELVPAGVQPASLGGVGRAVWSEAGHAASVPGSVKARRWSPKSAMISRWPPRAST